METIIDVLKSLDLTDGESRVYVALLELGASTVGPVVKKSGVASSKIYEIMHRLIDKGLVSYVTKNATKYFQAVHPSSLKFYLEQKELHLAEQKEKFEKALPRLQTLTESIPSQEAEVFVGVRGMRTAYEKLFMDRTAKDENLFFMLCHDENFEKMDAFIVKNMDLWKKVKARGITTREFKKHSKGIPLSLSENTGVYRYVSFPIPGNIEIFRDKVMMTSWKNPIMATLTQSAPIARQWKEYFESVWKNAKR